MASPIEPHGPGQSHQADFRLSITKALGGQLAEAPRTLGRAPLREANLRRLQNRSGVHQLFTRGEPEDEFVYVERPNHFPHASGSTCANCQVARTAH